MSDKNTSFVGARILGLLLAAALLIVTSAICTQFVAGRLAYHPALGSPLFGNFYNPLDWWGWAFRFFDYAPDIYRNAFLIFMAGALVAMFSAALIVGIKSRSSRKHEGIHGTAHFATADEVKETGLMGTSKERGGVYVGGFDNDGRTEYLRHDGPEHICVIAPTRSGKGVGLVIPTLLSWSGSVFALDPKGDNYATTSGWRKKHANNAILRFEPAVPGLSCSWNPLSEIRFGTRYQISDTQNISLMVVDSDGFGLKGNHFRSAAFELLVGVILHALYKAERVGRAPCLQDCAHMLTGVGDFAAVENERQFDDGDPRALEGLFLEMQNVALSELGEAAQEAQLVIRGIGHRMANTPARELGSIISTANNELSLYRDPIVGENTSRSDFKVSDLMNHERPVSLYFITTFQDKDRMRPLARLLISRILLGLSGQMEFEGGRSQPTYKHRLLLMLDEFPTLGKLEVLESALAYIAGYGMKAYLITQDVQQIYKAYTNYESIIANCHIRVTFAPNRLETAEWLSKMTGQTTVVKEHVSTSGKRFGMVFEQASRSYQEVQRPLMTADEIMRLPGPTKNEQGDILTPGEMLIFVAGHSVIRGRQILYFLDPTFSKRSKIEPPKVSDVVRT